VSSIDEMVNHLRAAVDRIRDAVAGVRRAGGMADELRDRFADLGVYGLVERMNQVRHSVERLETQLLTSMDLGQKLIAQAEAIKGSGASPASVPITPTTERQAPALHVVQAAQRLPIRTDDQGPTRGFAFDSDGLDLYGDLVSGHNLASTAGLRLIAGMRGWPWTLTDHVESAVATRMREPGAAREVTLVLNNAPCDRGRYGCEYIVAHLIPSGSRLSVYLKDPSAPGGVRYHRTYHGTGRMMEP
jgi:hypothetical protein